MREEVRNKLINYSDAARKAEDSGDNAEGARLREDLIKYFDKESPNYFPPDYTLAAGWLYRHYTHLARQLDSAAHTQKANEYLERFAKSGGDVDKLRTEI